MAKEYTKSGDDLSKVPYAMTDFSQRGMTSIESAEANGAAHLLFFNKTANMPAIKWAMDYYEAKLEDFKNAGTPSTEHSVMCSYGHDEEAAFDRLLTLYPNGNLSIVSDTYDLWNVIQNILPKFKDRILARNGTIIIRPDSGNPVDIICGTRDGNPNHAVDVGVVELLAEVFPCKPENLNDKLLLTLDPHIRVIYGDAITYDRAKAICENLREHGFTASNVIFGIGSYTYQYTTRDTYGQAFKATHAVIDGKEVFLYKDPITDESKMKKSQKGLCVVYWDFMSKEFKYRDEVTTWGKNNSTYDLLRIVFLEGNLLRTTEFADIRERVRWEFIDS
jgi:nicotinamide phosphoribosyltransferase